MAGTIRPSLTCIPEWPVYGPRSWTKCEGLLRDTMDRVVRTPAQVEAALQSPCLSLVPLLTRRERKLLSRRGASQTEKDVAQRTLSKRSRMYWAAAAMPLSRFAESIRSIK